MEKLEEPLKFEYVGCYQSDARLVAHGKRTVFNVKMNIKAPTLREDLMPEEMNSTKYLEPEQIFDFNIRRDEKYTDDGAGEKMESILKFIEMMDTDERVLKKRIAADIICNRGLLSRLGYLPELRFRAVRRKGVIFMCYTSRIDTSRDCKHSHRCLKMEKTFTDDAEFMASSRNLKILRSGLRRKTVHRIEFGKSTVFSSAEIDAKTRDDKNVEIKWVRESRDRKWKDQAAEKVFLQCYLGNVDTLVFGYSKLLASRQVVVDEIEMIHRDCILDDFQGVQFCLQRIARKLDWLRDLLNTDDKAVSVKQYGSETLDYDWIDADSCEFIPDDFLDMFY